MKARLLATVEEHRIGDDDRVFFAHQVESIGSGPVTAGTKAGWYWQARGSSEAYGPFFDRSSAESDYKSVPAE